MSEATLINCDICHRTTSLRKLYFVTLTYFLKFLPTNFSKNDIRGESSKVKLLKYQYHRKWEQTHENGKWLQVPGILTFLLSNMHLITKEFLHIFLHLNCTRRRVALVSQLQQAKPVYSHLIAVSVAPPTDDGNLCVGQFNQCFVVQFWNNRLWWNAAK